MNKSILLVMCDMLVLSVMSLSNGGFSQGESGRRGEVATVVDYTALTQKLEEAEKRTAAAQEREDDAWDEVVRLQDAAARAKADAEAARTSAKKAEADAERANNEAAEYRTKAGAAQAGEALALKEADAAKAELAEIRARQTALTGNIPQQLSWEVIVSCKDGKKRERRHVHSPLVRIDTRQFVFFEWKKLKIKSLGDIVGIVVRQGEAQYTGTIAKVERLPNMAFVEIKPGAECKSIGFGLTGLPRLDDNIVYRPEDGSCAGSPVPCESDTGNNLYCSVSKQQVRDVDEGAFLLSREHGCVAAIAKEKDGPMGLLGERRKCEVLRPIQPEELIEVVSWVETGENDGKQGKRP